MKLKTEPPSALVVRCADNRFQPAMVEFIHRRLWLKEGDYIPIAIPGSIQSLALDMILPKRFRVLKDQIELLLANHNTIPRIVLINHEGCRAYTDISQKLAHLFSGTILEKQLEDLKTAANAINEIAGRHGHKVEAELYVARVRTNGSSEVYFETVNDAAKTWLANHTVSDETAAMAPVLGDTVHSVPVTKTN